MSLASDIREFIEANLSVFDDDVVLKDDDNFFELGFVDSSFAMQIVLFVEEKYHVAVTDEDLDLINFSTISRMVKFIEKKKGD